MKIEGGCLCSRTQYELSVEPFSVGNCHCIDCRRSSGAPFVTWGSVPAAAMQVVKGEVRRIAFAGRVRAFAGCCGTPLFFAESETAAELDVTIASFDDPEPYPPRKNIWIEDRLSWVGLDPALPAFAQSSATSV